MEKRKGLVIILVFLAFINIFYFQNSFAEDHKLEKLDISVFINDDGSAKITERRKAILSEGTENYIVIENLGKFTIKDFVVKEDGKTYQYVEDWDIDASRGQKTFRNGIIETADGYELCWGIGEYGSHKYILEYTVTDFIKELQDRQILFWRFVNDETNIPPESVTITIESKNAFNQREQEIYAFGYTGDIEFVDGKIVAKSAEPLDSSNYVTILVGLPEGMFQTNDFLDMDFEEIKEGAFIGSDYNLEDEDYYNDYDNEFYDNNYNRSSRFFGIIGSIIPLFVAIVVFASIFSKASSSQVLGKFKRKYKGEYYRDYPYEGEIIDIYHILYKMGKGNFENLLTSFILKWIKEEKIITETEQAGLIIKREQTNIRFLDKNVDRSTLEGQLFFMMLNAAGSNNILEEKEFTKWASRNRNKIESWEKKVKNTSSTKLQGLGYLKMEEKRVLFFKTNNIILTSKGETLEERVYKYINYLYDYSLLNEHEAVNVKIWDNIMIWAAALGLTEVVQKQFEKLYPKYNTETVYRGNSIYLAHALTRNVARAAAPPANTTRSGGGGGFSSGGGGGGSFGGGSGGGTR